MKNVSIIRCTAAFILMLPIVLCALPAQSQALTTEQWRNDLAFLAKELPKQHRAPFHKISPQAFDSAVAALNSRIPTLKDYEVVVGLTKLVAMIGDGHTRLTLPQDQTIAYSRAHTTTPPPSDSSLFLNHLPVKLALFDDGLFIQATTPAFKHLIGAQVLQIGAASAADAAIEKVRPVVHYDNEMGFKLLAPTFLVVPEFLAALGLTDNAQQAFLKVKTQQGAVQEVVLAPVPLFKAPDFVDAYEVLGTKAPLSQRNRKEKYWMEFLPETKTLYVQVNEVYNKEDESIAAFSARIEKFIAAHPTSRLVLDLRYNPGGNNRLSRPLLLALIRNEQVNQFGRLYMLIGRETFSAAQMLANEMEYYTNTIFAGEPSGSSPSAYGDSRKLYLPNSNLTIRASTIYWRDWHINEKRPWTEPDIIVGYTSEDYLKGRDPALEAVLKLPADSDISTIMQQIYDQNGIMSAAWAYSRFILDARTSQPQIEKAEKDFGQYLLQKEKGKDAAIWYGEMSSLRKGTIWPLHGLAQAHLLNKETQKAEAVLEKILTLDPNNKQAKNLLSSIRKKKAQG
ncbi:hypothetical protein ACFSRY_02905 [Pontibacter locisalis]|uniref:Tail specific protease domain-containing protein n=1 Tax=Pontibacter locisalis TaxID=1719035 RepID=A0ABW5IIR2_9BACT